ncbi:MAG: hypothetical protein AAGA48_23415 [Myxococcota bacterium]
MVIPDNDPSDPNLRRWLASRIEKSMDGADTTSAPADSSDPNAPSEVPSPLPDVDAIDDGDEVDQTEMSQSTDAVDAPGHRFEQTTQTQSPAGMARLRHRLGLPPIPGRPEADEVLAKAPAPTPRPERPSPPPIPQQRVVDASGPLPKRSPGPSSGALPLSTGPGTGASVPRLSAALGRRNRVDPWADEDDEDEAQTVLASPWTQQEVDWPQEPETIRSWGAMMRRESVDDPDTVRHNKMPVSFIGEAVIDDETVLDPASRSQRWRDDHIYQPPPPDIEPSSSPLPQSRPEPPGGALAGRPTQRLADIDDDWVPMFSEESEPGPSGSLSAGPPPLPQGVRTIQLPEPPPSVPPQAAPRLPSSLPPSPPSPRPVVDLASQTTVAKPPPDPVDEAQRRQTIVIVLMLALAAGMGFVVLGLGMLL